MAQKLLPSVGSMTAQLAADTARIIEFVDGLPTHVDRLVEAALDRDWSEVDRLTQKLIEEGGNPRAREIRAFASAVRREIAKPDNETGIKRSLIRLIGGCGSLDPRKNAPAPMSRPARGMTRQAK